MANPSVAIIVLNWNGYPHTRDCLESLSSVSYDNFKVWVVDNGSTDDSYSRLTAEFRAVEWIANTTNLGFAGGNNVGIRKALSAGFAYVVLLNNDTTVEPDFIDHLITHLRQHPEYGAAQPQIRWSHAPETIWNGGGGYNAWTGQTRSLHQHQRFDEVSFESDTDWITGCCICLSGKVIEDVGLLDESFFAYYEDVDWSFRMVNAGYRLALVPAAVIYHVAGAASNAAVPGREGRLSPQVHFLNTRNQIRIIRRYFHGWKRITALIYSVSRSMAILLYFAVRGRRGKMNAVWRGLQEAFDR